MVGASGKGSWLILSCIRIKSCTWQEVRCPHCNELFTQYNLTKFHIVSCSQRKVACPYCKTHQDTQSQLKAVHYAVCPMYPVPCPNNCGAKPFRKNVAKHVDDSCPLTVTECFFKHAGCDAQLTRRDMKQHADSNLPEHLTMSMSKIANLKGAPDPVARELYFQTEYCMNIIQIPHSRTP